MRKERMTVEELNSLKPSYDNPITLECDDGFFDGRFEAVKAISPVHNDRFSVMDSDGEFEILDTDDLYHYPSLKPEKKRWFELWVKSEDGVVIRAQTVVCLDYKDPHGGVPYIGCKRALGREVTAEIEKLEWK